MAISKKYSYDYGMKRQFGYGGYKYDGRWKHIAKKLLKSIN